jgi:RHS repeat-associated protein
MRIKNGATNLVFYLYADHLGSTNVVSDPVGQMVSLSLYMPWGRNRGGAGTQLTDYGFTGQRSMEGTIGLYYFNARWYDSSLGRWAQPDSILPLASQGVQAWDRYEFANDNSVNNIDSTGHSIDCGLMEPDCQHVPLNEDPYTAPFVTIGPSSSTGTTIDAPKSPGTTIGPNPKPGLQSNANESQKDNCPPFPVFLCKLTVPTVINDGITVKEIVESPITKYTNPNPFDPLSIAWDFGYQVYNDRINGYSWAPSIARGASVAVEQVATGVASLAIGGSVFTGVEVSFGAVVTPLGSLSISIPAGIVAGGATYFSVNNKWDDINQKTLFPFINESIGN